MKLDKNKLIKGLKSMIGPFVILLLIGIAILVITLYDDGEEAEEIVEVYAYSGESATLSLENDELLFELDPTTTQFTLTVKDTGKVWYSNPQDAENDSLALESEKDKLRSTLLMTYSTINGIDALYNSYDYSITKGIYELETGDDYIKVKYSLGDVEKEYTIPPVIREADMEALMANMEQSDALMVQDYYKKYDINNLGKKDDKDELLANYPILETEVIYVLRDTTKDNIKTKFEKIFEAAGYTLEQYTADKALDMTTTSSDKPIFDISVIYRLDGGDLVVEVPLSEIDYKEDYPLYDLTLLPYFGAGSTQEDGFLLVPEGGGALIDFNNGKTSQNSYYANVYGWDMALDRDYVVHETEANMPLYGIASDGSSFLCLLEGGASYASIQADVSGKLNSYNYANAVYSIAQREQYDVSDKVNGKMYVYLPSLPDETLTQRYRFIDSDSYVDMAKEYQSYLKAQYGDYLTLNDDTSTPVSVEILGAVDKVKQVLGVPVSRPLKLTSYEEAQQMIETLLAEGMDNMSVKLTGWANGGVQQQMLSKVKTVSALGSKKDLQSLTDYAAANGVDLYLDGITNYAIDSNLLDGFFVYTDAARFISKEKAELYEYRTVTYKKDEDEDPYYLLHADLIMEMADNLSDAAADYGAGVSFQDIGDTLSSDFYRKNTVSRESALTRQQVKLQELDDEGMPIMINAGNDYAIAYADMVTNMNLEGYDYTILDHSIPFYQLAIHGYVNYTGESLNLAQNYEQELLKSAEYGAGLSFTLMQETAFALQKTTYTEYFGADYSGWHDKMMEIYNRYNSELGHIYDQQMTDHELLDDDLVCTTYEDGTRVYVNYGYYDATAPDGTMVAARDYTVVR